MADIDLGELGKQLDDADTTWKELWSDAQTPFGLYILAYGFIGGVLFMFIIWLGGDLMQAVVISSIGLFAGSGGLLACVARFGFYLLCDGRAREAAVEEYHAEVFAPAFARFKEAQGQPTRPVPNQYRWTGYYT